MKESMGIVTSILECTQVLELQKGAIVGDLCGGRSFNDNVAAALERRSYRGWCDIRDGDQLWTLILIEH